MADDAEMLRTVRAALRREIGDAPSAKGDGWQPMVAAYEIRLLLDALDTADAERAQLRRDVAGQTKSATRAWASADGLRQDLATTRAELGIVRRDLTQAIAERDAARAPVRRELTVPITRNPGPLHMMIPTDGTDPYTCNPDDCGWTAPVDTSFSDALEAWKEHHAQSES